MCDRRANALKAIGSFHEEFVALWGPDYREHSRFEKEVIEKVMNGHYVRHIIDELKPIASKKSARIGWSGRDEGHKGSTD